MAAPELLLSGALPPLAEGLFNMAKVMKNLRGASEEIRDFAEDVDILAGVLVQLEESLQTVAASNAAGSECKLAERIVAKMQTTIQKMTDHSNLVSVVMKDIGFFQQLLARLKWLHGKSSMMAAKDTIHGLTLSASAFLQSMICKALYADIGNRQDNGEQVPRILYLKLKATINMCQREERKFKAVSQRLASVSETVLMQTGLDLGDIRGLRRIGKRAVEKANRTVEKATPYTRDASSQRRPKPGGSSSKRLRGDVPFRPSPRSVSPRTNLASQQASRWPNYGQPFQENRSRPRNASRQAMRPSWPPPLALSDPPSLSSGLGSSEATPPAANHAATERAYPIMHPSSASLDVPGPSNSKERRGGIYGSRVRDDGVNVTVEESDWPAELLLRVDQLPTTASLYSESIASTDRDADEEEAGQQPSRAKESENVGETSSLASRRSRNNEQQQNQNRMPAKYKPCPPYKEDDRESRRRRRGK